MVTVSEFTRVFEMCARRIRACGKSFKPFVNSHVDNVPVKLSPDLNQLLSVEPFIDELRMAAVSEATSFACVLTIYCVYR